jgi:glucose-1-phosphate cytidylyltransferase
MVEIGGRPILWHIMKLYAYHGFRDFVLCLGYRGEIIKDYFLNYEAMNTDFTVRLGSEEEITYHGGHNEQDFSVTLAETGPETMTGGRVKRVGRYLDDDTFMVAYGDTLSDVDLSALLEFHRAHGKMATITAVRPVSRFGILELGNGGSVERFAEKPEIEGWASSGFFVFNKRFLEYLDDDDTILEREPLEKLAAEGELVAYQHRGFFYAMDTYREYQFLNELWQSGNAPWKAFMDDDA